MTTTLYSSFPFLILILCCVFNFINRLSYFFKFGLQISETDSRFNWICSQYMQSQEIANFFQWYDNTSWYPQGRDIGTSSFPGLPLLLSYLFNILSYFRVIISFESLGIFIGPFVSTLNPLFFYLFVKLITKQTSIALLSAFISSNLSILVNNSFSGFLDNQAISLTIILIEFYLFSKNILEKLNMRNIIIMTFLYGFLCLNSGEYIYLANIFSLLTFLSILRKDFTINLYFTFSIWYIFSALFSISIPTISRHLFSFSYFLPHITYICLNVYALSIIFPFMKFVFIVIIISLCLNIKSAFDLTGRLRFILFPFFFRPSENEIREKSMVYSVEEQYPSSWSIFLVDFGPLIYLFPIGAYMILKNHKKMIWAVYLLIVSLFTLYLASMSMRVLTLFSISFVLIVSIAVDTFLRQSFKSIINYKTSYFDSFLCIGLISLVCLVQIVHCTFNNCNPSYETTLFRQIEVSTGPNTTRIIDSYDYHEGLMFIKENTDINSKILANWPIGYQISSHTNRTTFCDGNTNDFDRLNFINLIYMSPEYEAWEMARYLGADYIVIIFGGASGYVYDDIYFSSSSLRNLEKKYGNISIDDYFDSVYLVSNHTKEKARESLLFKLSYNHFKEWHLNQLPNGFDIARGFQVDGLDFQLKYFQEVFSSSNWLYRIYRILPFE